MTELDLERAAGMLAGVAIGDALGMPSEFLTPELIEEWYGRITTFLPARPQHPHHRLPPGSVTDDTDHTLILANLLIDQGEIEPRVFADRLLAWSKTPRVQENQFVGPSTLRSLEALTEGRPLDQVPRTGTSVGAAMRVAALAIAIPNRARLIDQVVASCEVSHFTFNAISGAMAMAFALSESLLPGADLLSIARAAQQGAVTGRSYGDWSWAPPIERRIQYIIGWIENYSPQDVLARLRDLIGSDLYPQQLVPCAIGLFLLTKGDPQQAMSLGANMGGDTDTLASMVGSLCGGLKGLSAVDADLLEQVETVNRLNLLATAESLVSIRRRSEASQPAGEG